jgi:hypothetical protein
MSGSRTPLHRFLPPHVKPLLEGIWEMQPSLSGGLGAGAPKGSVLPYKVELNSPTPPEPTIQVR